MFTRTHRVNTHLTSRAKPTRFSCEPTVSTSVTPFFFLLFFCQPSPCPSLNCRLGPTHRRGRMHASALAECDRPCSTCSTGKSPAQVCCLLPLRHAGETAKSAELDALSDSTPGPGERIVILPWADKMCYLSLFCSCFEIPLPSVQVRWPT